MPKDLEEDYLESADPASMLWKIWQEFLDIVPVAPLRPFFRD